MAEIKLEAGNGQSEIFLRVEPFDGAFWRWLFVVSGWSPVGADATLLLEGVTVHRAERDTRLSESSCPIRFAALERVHGYTSELRELFEETDRTTYTLIHVVAALTSLLLQTLESFERGFRRRDPREFVMSLARDRRFLADRVAGRTRHVLEYLEELVRKERGESGGS